MYTPVNPSFAVIRKWGVQGSTLYGLVNLMVILFQTKMKDLLGLCLAVSLAAVGTAHRHQSSVQRSTTRHQSSAARGFLFFVKEKMRNVGLEITEVKEKINDCCDQAGQ